MVSFISPANKSDCMPAFHVTNHQIFISVRWNSSLRPIFLLDYLFSYWLKAFGINFGYHSFVNFMCFKYLLPVAFFHFHYIFDQKVLNFHVIGFFFPIFLLQFLLFISYLKIFPYSKVIKVLLYFLIVL